MKKFDISELAKKISRKFPQTAAVFAGRRRHIPVFGGAGKGAENGEESPSGKRNTENISRRQVDAEILAPAGLRRAPHPAGSGGGGGRENRRGESSGER